MHNRMLEKSAAGKPVIGTITHMKSTVAVEAAGTAGLDYIMLDMEHCPMDWSDVLQGVTAADASGITPIVRIAEGTRSAVLHALDIGAHGIVVPCVETAEQVRDLISWAKFPPLGARGYCMTRDGLWGYDDSYARGLDSYMAMSNAQTLLIPQCETAGCLEHIEEIAAMQGVDGILIGPYDLSIAMGIPGQFDCPDFREALARILSACRTSGKICIVFAGSAEEMQQRLNEGFDNILFGLDVLSLIRHYTDVAEAFREAQTAE